MSRLPNLRNAEDIYRKLSVRDDYTLEERELIKGMGTQGRGKK